MSRPVASALLATLVAFLALALFTAPGRGTWVVDPDAAAYVGLARSIAAGDGYTFAGEPHAKFPPGFPAFLALAVAITGDPQCYAAMRDLVTAAGLVTVLLTYFVGTKLLRLGRPQALALTALAGTSIYLAQYAVSFLRSEPLFAALFLGSLLAGESWRARGGAGWALLAGALAGGATLVRVAGATAILAILVARVMAPGSPLAGRRRVVVELCLFLVTAAGPAALFAARNARLAPAGGYGDELFAAYALDVTKDVDVDMPAIDAAGMVRRVADNAAVLALGAGKFVANHNKGANLATVPTDARSVALHPGGLALLGLLALGGAVAARRRLVLVVIVLPLYVGLYLIWPFNQQERFYMPVQPLLLGLLGFAVPVVARAGLALLARTSGRWLAAFTALAIASFLAARRSVDGAVLGRWSAEYALVVAAAGAAAVAALGLALAARGRRLGTERWLKPALTAGLVAFVALHAAGFALFLRGIGREHAAFEAARAAKPVDPAFARIKALPELFELLDVLKRHAQPDDLVMSDIPKIVHVLTGLRTTPLRFSSASRTLVLDTPQGRPAFLYYSREIPEVNGVFDEFLRTADFERLIEIPVAGGPAGYSVSLYRVPR